MVVIDWHDSVSAVCLCAADAWPATMGGKLGPQVHGQPILHVN